MKFKMDKLVGVVVNGIRFDVKSGTNEPRPSFEGFPQADWTSVELEDGGFLCVKDKSVDALIFSDKDIVH